VERCTHGFVVKPVGKRPPERPRRRWVDNINTNLNRLGFMDWIYLAGVRDNDWLL
jgi:hypothetical protein